MYVVEIEREDKTEPIANQVKGLIVTANDVNILNLKLIDDDCCYALVKTTPGSKGGIKIFMLNVFHN
jgi:hypothetical protein